MGRAKLALAGRRSSDQRRSACLCRGKFAAQDAEFQPGGVDAACGAERDGPPAVQPAQATPEMAGVRRDFSPARVAVQRILLRSRELIGWRSIL